MARPPRNLKKDRLMSIGMMVYIQFYVGLMNIVASFIGQYLALVAASP